MSSQTATSLLGFPLPTDLTVPEVLSGDQIYDMLMSKIELELTTAQLALLDEKYKGETKPQAQARAERYKKAFHEYQRQFQEYMDALEQRVHVYERHVLAFYEQEQQSGDAESLSAIESQFNS